jgi:hypothetical protein
MQKPSGVRFWSWDPKEVWSAITWLFYAALLHERLTVGWRGKRAAIMAIIGFGALIFTFLGVNFLTGRPPWHLYGDVIMRDIVLLGLNHKTASVDVRECIAFTADETDRALEALRTNPIIGESVLCLHATASNCSWPPMTSMPR